MGTGRGHADFFTAEVPTWRGLLRFFVLFVAELSTHKVEIAGIASGLSMSQIGRNLIAVNHGIFHYKRYLIP